MATMESLFINTKVFDPSLEGQAVALSGSLIEGNFIICKVNNYSLDVIGAKTKAVLPIADFEHGAIELVVLEPPRQNVVDSLPVLKFEDPQKKHKTGFTRNQGVKNFRSDLQIKVDNAHIEYILQENIEPLKLDEILKRMVENHGHWHWNSKNACGFVNHAIKCGKRIKKTGYAFYSYDWEAEK